MMPGTPVGKILIQRDESSEDKHAVFYYAKLPPDIATRRVLLVDPMLGTGGSSKAAIATLIRSGVPEENIVFINLLGCTEGVNAVLSAYPKIKLVTAKVDPILNAKKYLVPGIGDFGDRYFGTVSK
jgi:uracil phosphoribosyltransferase